MLFSDVIFLCLLFSTRLNLARKVNHKITGLSSFARGSSHSRHDVCYRIDSDPIKTVDTISSALPERVGRLERGKGKGRKVGMLDRHNVELQKKRSGT